MIKTLLKPEEECCGNCTYISIAPYHMGEYSGICGFDGRYVNTNSSCHIYLCPCCGQRIEHGSEIYKIFNRSFIKMAFKRGTTTGDGS